MTPNSLPSLVLKTLPKIWFTITSPNARLTRRFGAAKRRKIGRCAADCYALLVCFLANMSIKLFL